MIREAIVKFINDNDAFCLGAFLVLGIGPILFGLGYFIFAMTYLIMTGEKP